MSNFLPSDWKDVLRQIGSWLDEAGRTAEVRERDFAERFPATPAVPRPELDTAQLGELAARMRSLEASAAEAEGTAVAEETQLRQRVERSETLRLRLAERLGEPDARTRTTSLIQAIPRNETDRARCGAPLTPALSPRAGRGSKNS